MSATAKFRRCDAVTAAWEGGYVDHPKDPGGATDRGVTQGTFDNWRRSQGLALKPVKGVSADEAEALFASMFWDQLRCETLAVGVDLATYDAGVNSGVSRARKWLMASIGGDPADTVKKICAKRLGFMQALAIWKTFGKGWGLRVADIQAKGVAWALAASGSGAVATGLQLEAAAKQKAATTQNRAAAGTGVAGGGAGVGADQAHLADWLLVGFGAVVVVAIAILVIRAALNRQQAEAYAREVGTLA